jgi:hypothetical protein
MKHQKQCHEKRIEDRDESVDRRYIKRADQWNEQISGGYGQSEHLTDDIDATLKKES